MAAPRRESRETLAAASWLCPTCRTGTTSPFCAGCGERPLDPRELTLRGLALMFARAFTNVDGRLLRSFRLLVTRPGDLTVAFAEGRRRPFIGPISLFLVANVLFFALQSLTEFRIFAATLDYHMYDQVWQALARDLVTSRLAELGTTLEVFAPRFDEALSTHAKSLIGILVLPMSALLPLVFRRERKALAVHAVFALHFHSFLLLLFCAPLAFVIVYGWLGGDARSSQGIDDAMTLMLLACCAAHVFVATGRVYAERGLARVLKTLVMTVEIAAGFLGYKFLLFLITLWTT